MLNDQDNANLQKMSSSQKMLWVALFIALALLGLIGIKLIQSNQALARAQQAQEKIKFVPVVAHKEPTVREKVEKEFSLAPLPAVEQFNAADYLSNKEPTDSRFNPPIQNQKLATLLEGAKKSRVAGDLKKTALTLEQAESLSPKNPHLLYQYGELYERLGVFDKAMRYYQTLFQLGTEQAGPLFQIASQKLQGGFNNIEETPSVLALGTIKQFKDTRVTTGEQIVLSIPVLAAPDQEIDPSLVEVIVRFFDQIGNSVNPASPLNQPTYEWATEPVDWNTNEDELLNVRYYLPKITNDEYDVTVGRRKYFGYSIELHYEGVAMDQIAWPRTLAQKIQNSPNLDYLSFPFDGEENLDNMLLPALPDNF